MEVHVDPFMALSGLLLEIVWILGLQRVGTGILPSLCLKESSKFPCKF